MKLSALLSALEDYRLKMGEKQIFETSEIEISGLCADSRVYKKGELFICLTGGKVDSHKFAAEALEKGAAAVLTEREIDCDGAQIIVRDTREAMSLLSAAFFGEPSKKLKIIGITGTNGKTTTSYMLAEILKSSGKKTGIIGTLGIYYDKKQIAPELTTPDPIFLQKILADMLAKNVEYVVMEVSAHALYYKKVEGIRFTACIFSNLTQDHLDFFSSMQEYKKAKLELFAPERCSIAIVNADDETSAEILSLREKSDKSGATKTCLYGLKTPTDSFAVVTEENVREIKFLINKEDNLARINLRFTGLHNVYNALAAAVCALELGRTTEAVEKGLNGLKGVKGRLEWIAEYNGADIFVDFAHTPDGLEKSLTALKKHCKGKLICVFGCGGNRDKSKRPLMGERAVRLADFCYLTSDNPRFEDPSDIIKDIEKGARRFSTAYVAIPERERAVTQAIASLGVGDILLIAGKGAEDYQERMGIKYVYNDENLILKTIKKD